MQKLILVLFTFLIYLQGFGQLGEPGSTQNNVNQTDVNGLKQGPWQKNHPNSRRLAYKGIFKDNKPVGRWEYFNTNGELSALLEYMDSDSAVAKILHENGTVKAAGIYFNQKKYGKWNFYDNRTILSSTQYFFNDIPNGDYIIFYINGKVAEKMTFDQGILVNKWERFFENGTLRSTVSYTDGKLNGTYIENFESGKLNTTGNYKDDNQVGEWKVYFENGLLKEKIIFDQNGNKKELIPVNGEFKEYNDSEILKATYNYKNGEKHGEFTQYHPDAYWEFVEKPLKDPFGEVISNEVYKELRNHTIMCKGKYENGKLAGKVVYYNKIGKVEKEELYELVE